MGLFEKKSCDFCGEKIGIFGNNRLKDANMCDECAKAVSRHAHIDRYTKEKMDKHLEYRKRNKKKVKAFNSTRVLGTRHKIHIDEAQGLFLVTKAKNFKKFNPDVLKLSQITGCNVDVDESRREIMRTTSDGERVSCIPPQYEYRCTMSVIIDVKSRWFSQIKVAVSDDNVDARSPEYDMADRTCREIRDTLLSLRQNAMDEAAEAAKPKAAVQCPYCGATTTPDERGCCEYCGGAI